MTTPPRFPLAKRSLDSLGLRRRHDPPPAHPPPPPSSQLFRPQLRARASSSSALAQRAGSMRFATAIPESYIQMTRKPPRKRNNNTNTNKKTKMKKSGHSRKAAIEYLPLSKRWALAAANAFRPSHRSNVRQTQAKRLRRVVQSAEISPNIPPLGQVQPFATPPERKSSLHSGAKTRSTPTDSKKLPFEKPLPSPPKPEVPDPLATEDQIPSSSKSAVEVEEPPLCQDLSGAATVSEMWPDLSPWKPPGSWKSNYHSIEVLQESQQPAPLPNERAASPMPTASPPPLPPSRPLTPPRSTLRHSRLRLTSNWAVDSSHLDTIFQATEPNDPMDKTSQNNPPAVLPAMVPPGNNMAVTQPPEKNSESNDNVTTAKPNPFRNRHRTVSSPQSTSQPRPQSGLWEFSFEFNTGYQNAGSTNGQNQPVADVMNCMEISNSHTTPRNENAASKIPRISPQVLTPPTTGDVGGGPHGGLKKARSPSRRSSIPIPSRMVHGRDKFDVSALPVSPLLKTGRNPSSVYGGTIYEDEALGDQKEFGPRKTRHLIDHSDMDHMETQPNDSTPVMTLRDGYISKELTAGGRSGPQLRISPEADKVIMGNMTDALEVSSQHSTGKRAKRLSGTKRFSGDSIFGSFTPKYLMHSQSNSSLNPSIHSPTEGQMAVAKERKLKKARSTDAAYANMPKKQHVKKFGTNPFYDDGIAGSVPSPGMFNERYPFLNGGGSDPYRYSEADVASQGYKALPSSPLAESTTLIEDNDVVYSQPGSRMKNAVPSPLNSHTSVDQLRNNNETESSNERDPSSSIVRHRSSSQRLLHRSSRHRITEHGSSGKSKLNNVAASNESTELVQKDAFEVPRRKHREISAKHRSLSTTRESSRAKESFAKSGSVLSNFRGLFTKQKNESTTVGAGAHHASAKASTSTTTAKRKDLERVKAANSGKLSTGSPMERSFSCRARGGSRADKRTEDKPSTPSRDASRDRSRPTSGALNITSQMVDSPALSGIRNVSALCMHVLDSARDEPNGSKKEKLIKLGKMLVETVNYSNDAERAMLAAVQAAKEAEISCAMAKENAMRMAQVAQDWIDCSNNDNASLH
ncbi:hypothetical protein EMCG_04260 [[Emmonsia] crescens]|uniref:Uncharacterized protein n=1 Tax=[Emmonsia] crescens TaxID=73230 RepID=A0A0G2HTQ5_9EURO|nr:hypothetical protein EMCG_04260 [Emmonsia crescens UAMH 3008]